jgi:hypothetical protein
MHRGEGECFENEQVEGATKDVGSGGGVRHGRRGGVLVQVASLDFRQKVSAVLSEVKRRREI